jgi:hypothetical protein
MVGRPRLRVFAGVLWLTTRTSGAGAVTSDELPRPEPSVGGEWARLELRSARSLHDGHLNGVAGRIDTHGSAVSPVGISGAWFARNLPLGVAGALSLERFSFQPEGGPGAASIGASGLDATAVLMARTGLSRFSLEGGLGYSFVRVPTLALVTGPGAMSVDGQTLTAHGVSALARAAVALHRSVDVEATARALPFAFGAHSQGVPLDLHRYAVGADLDIALLGAAGASWSLLAGYELMTTTAAGTGLELRQTQHRFGLGVRAVVRPVASARVAAPPTVAPPPASVRGRARGIVLGATGAARGEPLGGVTIAVVGGAVTRSDERGTFVLEGLEPGLATLRLSRDGFEPGEEVVSVPPEGEVSVEIRLRRVAAAAGALVVLIRTEDGAPVRATVRVVELALSARADKQGRCRFDARPGTFTLTIEAPGFDTQRRTVVVGAAQESIFNVDLQRQR